jgi:hypothetical protein
MTDWRERRLGGKPRPWGGGIRRQTRKPLGAAPMIITIAIRDSARDHATEALKALADLVKGASSEHVRVAAANAILDRAVGKPLSGAQAAEDAAAEEDGPLEIRWLDPEEE